MRFYRPSEYFAMNKIKIFLDLVLSNSIIIYIDLELRIEALTSLALKYFDKFFRENENPNDYDNAILLSRTNWIFIS